jgi:hypothetical protein
MKSNKVLSGTIAVIALTLGSAALAQDDAAHDAHHPAQGNEAQPGTNAPQSPMQSDQSGMMGMMRMMDMAQMMRMMNMMGGGTSAPDGMGMERMDPAGMAMTDHIEGRIAFLRAELKITDAQAPVWDGFANALRENARRLDEARKTAGSASAAPALEQRLAAQEQWLSARLEGVRAIKGTFGDLYQSLSPEQRKSADELLPMHMGLMPGGMNPMGMMQTGGSGQ